MAKRVALGKSSLTNIETNITEVLGNFERVNKSVRNLKAVKAVRGKSKYHGTRPTTKTTSKYSTVETISRASWQKESTSTKKGNPTFEDVITYVVEDAVLSLKGKARAWAIETSQMMKGLSPMRTENLMESIKIRTNDKGMDNTSRLNANGLLYVVGIDEKAILPPPARKRSKHGPTAGRMVKMATFNYAEDADKAILRLKSNGYQGYDFLRRWQQAAKENMERIFK